MKHGHISRNYAKAFFAFVTIGMAGACADQSVAPTADTPAFTAPANFIQVGAVNIFTVNNAYGTTRRVGEHVINIPAGAICDLMTSGYGAAHWDAPCNPHRGSVIITATVLQGLDGEPYVDFQPALRFAPNKEVTLFMREGRSDGLKQLAIKYCNNLGYCIDESLTDASLKPFRIGTTSIIGRRVKHFSGYVVAYEGDCTGTVRPLGDGSYMCEDGGFMRRSGYMVASGEDVTEVMKEKGEKSGEEEDETLF
jgi:hypothetical protein